MKPASLVGITYAGEHVEYYSTESTTVLRGNIRVAAADGRCFVFDAPGGAVIIGKDVLPNTIIAVRSNV